MYLAVGEMAFGMYWEIVGKRHTDAGADGKNRLDENKKGKSF